MTKKLTHIDRMVQKTRYDNKTLQVAIINRFLTALDDYSQNSPNFLLTEQGSTLMKEVVKLELKDQQIEAQRSINSTTNNLFLTVAQRALQEINVNDKKSLQSLEKDVANTILSSRPIPNDDILIDFEVDDD